MWLCRPVRAAVVALRIGSAVGGSFAARGSVGAAVVAFWIGSAVGGSFAACCVVGDVVVVECHGRLLSRPPLGCADLLGIPTSCRVETGRVRNTGCRAAERVE